MHVQVFKRKDEDADSVWGLSAAKKGGKKGKKGADRKPEQPVCSLSYLLTSVPVHIETVQEHAVSTRLLVAVFNSLNRLGSCTFGSR